MNDDPNISLQCRQLYESVQRLLQAERLHDAALECRTLCERFPRFVGGWEAGSFIAQRLGNLPKAREYIDRALALDGVNPLLRVRKARVLALLREIDEARRIIVDVEALSAPSAALRAQIAAFYTAINDHEKAMPHYREAHRLVPTDPSVCFNLAATERFLGNLDAAEALYEAGLRLRPRHHEARYIRAGLRKQTRASNHVAELEALLAGIGDDWQGEYHLCYALAKEYEDLGEYARSFSALERGGRTRRAHMRYDVADDVATMDAIIEAYPTAVADAVSGFDSREPLFVLGLPRTGTTLVERILGSHPDVSSVGETNNFAVEMTRGVQAIANGRALTRREMVALSPQIDFAALGRRYVESTRPDTGHRAHFIDKMPLNYLYCGLIARALPNARIVELVRHPLDACLSMYKQLFTLAYPFSYDLGDLGAYYVGYVRLMNHWHRTMPGRILRVRYEDLVSAQEPQTRRLLDFCGLEWRDACLAFERNTQASTTASAVQVRQKIYTSSIDRWKHFAEPLAGLAARIRSSADYRASGMGYDV